MARRINYRGKPKKRLNRYNPSHPSWRDVHSSIRSYTQPVRVVDPFDLAIAAFVAEHNKQAAARREAAGG